MEEKIKNAKEKITVPHNEFIEMFNVSNSDIKEGNKNVPFKAVLQIGSSKLRKNVTFRVLEQQISKESILFSRQGFLLYTILFDYYAVNQEKLDNDGYLTIKFREIHGDYRNKSYNRFGQIEEETLNSYMEGLEDLHQKEINIDLKGVKEYQRDEISKSIHQNLIEYELIKNKKGVGVAVRYKLGDFGCFLMKSKRMSDKLPIELIQVSYKEIENFFIGMYLVRIIFVDENKKRKKDRKAKNIEPKSISIKSILTNVMCFNRDGSKKGINKFQEIGQASQKTRLLQNFERHLKYVLDLLKDNEVIKDYDFTVDRLTAKNYSLKSTQIIIDYK